MPLRVDDEEHQETTLEDPFNSALNESIRIQDLGDKFVATVVRNGKTFFVSGTKNELPEGVRSSSSRFATGNPAVGLQRAVQTRTVDPEVAARGKKSADLVANVGLGALTATGGAVPRIAAGALGGLATAIGGDVQDVAEVAIENFGVNRALEAKVTKNLLRALPPGKRIIAEGVIDFVVATGLTQTTRIGADSLLQDISPLEAMTNRGFPAGLEVAGNALAAGLGMKLRDIRAQTRIGNGLLPELARGGNPVPKKGSEPGMFVVTVAQAANNLTRRFPEMAKFIQAPEITGSKRLLQLSRKTGTFAIESTQDTRRRISSQLDQFVEAMVPSNFRNPGVRQEIERRLVDNGTKITDVRKTIDMLNDSRNLSIQQLKSLDLRLVSDTGKFLNKDTVNMLQDEFFLNAIVAPVSKELGNRGFRGAPGNFRAVDGQALLERVTKLHDAGVLENVYGKKGASGIKEIAEIMRFLDADETARSSGGIGKAILSIAISHFGFALIAAGTGFASAGSIGAQIATGVVALGAIEGVSYSLATVARMAAKNPGLAKSVNTAIQARDPQAATALFRQLMAPLTRDDQDQLPIALLADRTLELTQ